MLTCQPCRPEPFAKPPPRLSVDFKRGGAGRYEITGTHRDVVNFYCTMCQRLFGGFAPIPRQESRTFGSTAIAVSTGFRRHPRTIGALPRLWHRPVPGTSRTGFHWHCRRNPRPTPEPEDNRTYLRRRSHKCGRLIPHVHPDFRRPDQSGLRVPSTPNRARPMRTGYHNLHRVVIGNGDNPYQCAGRHSYRLMNFPHASGSLWHSSASQNRAISESINSTALLSVM